MREGVMSAGVLFARSTVQVEEEGVSEAGGWNPEDFARAQIRSLVRRVFLSNVERPVRQVVFSAVDAETDVKSLCRQVGEALALEIEESIAVVGEHPQVLQDTETCGPEGQEGCASLRQAATRLHGKLWLVPPVEQHRMYTAVWLHSHLSAVRSEFAYSIVEGPPAGESNEATLMAQFADGIILVLSACSTRRVVARKIKDALKAAQARVLGTVLTDRVFPIPEGIYRRL